MKWRLAGSNPNKYRNVHTACSCGAVKFPSRAHAKRFSELVLLERAKEIRDLRIEVPFEFACGTFYIADFVYFDNKPLRWVAEDKKGKRTAVYQNKKRMFLHEFPQYLFLET